MRSNFLRIVAGVAALTIIFAFSAHAHHSIAGFDKDHPRELKGVVKQFDWTNPHALIWVFNDAEPHDLWAVELTSPGVLTRNGWTKRSFKPGDKVTFLIWPMRDGKPGGLFKKATFTDGGKVLSYIMQPQDGPGL